MYIYRLLSFFNSGSCLIMCIYRTPSHPSSDTKTSNCLLLNNSSQNTLTKTTAASISLSHPCLTCILFFTSHYLHPPLHIIHNHTMSPTLLS
uniref:Uncharacterized protein n=1 Tax=Octopus bimaculoides TaxID=37653 RepID=A0A0L8GQC8_OCTBM